VAAALARLRAREKLDLVEFADWGSEAYVHLLNQTDWNHIPTVIHLHGPIVMFAHAIGWPDLNSEFYRVARMMEETCLRRADAVFSSSQCSAQWCERFHGLDSRRTPVIHVGVDTSCFRPLDLSKEERPTILFVGKIERNKGVDFLAEAAMRLAGEAPNLRLRLIGRGDEKLLRQLRRQADAIDPNLLEIAGYVNHSRLPEQFSRAHVFAAPSEYEGGPGFVYLEAMACGLPVIACSGSGAAEVVTPGETGFLIPPRDVNALVDVLRRLLVDSNLRATMGRKGIDYVRREADRTVCLRRLEAFYTAAAGKQVASEVVR
jgi:glycosyltransferase involved in cell wall biosynthesis